MDNKKFSMIIKSLGIALLIISCLMATLIWYVTKPQKLGGDFSANYRGQQWTLSQNAKELNLLYIGYMRCPDICPMTMSVVSNAFKKLTEEERARVNFIFLSVDSKHDKPESVADYAEDFYPEFIGLSGTKEEIQKIVNTFGASFIIEEDDKSHLGYSIAHTDRLYFLDENGIVMGSILNPGANQNILTEIKENL